MDEVIKIPIITLNWSEWYKWNDLKLDTRSKINHGVKVPNKQSGVYEARYENRDARLTIGKASNLRMRVRQGLVKGKVPHSTGERMKSENVDFTKVIVRWAVTDRPSATEEELHKKYVQKYGKLPEYVKRT